MPDLCPINLTSYFYPAIHKVQYLRHDSMLSALTVNAPLAVIWDTSNILKTVACDDKRYCGAPLSLLAHLVERMLHNLYTYYLHSLLIELGEYLS